MRRGTTTCIPPQSIRLWSSFCLALPAAGNRSAHKALVYTPQNLALRRREACATGFRNQVCLLHRGDLIHPELWWQLAAGLPRRNHGVVVRKCPIWDEPPTASSSFSLLWRLHGSGQALEMSLGTLFLYPETRTSATVSLY